MTEKTKRNIHLLQNHCKCLPSETAASCKCFVNQLHHAIEGRLLRQRTLQVFAPFLALMLFISYLFVTAPYGLTEDGQKVDTPYVIKAGNVELAVVQDETTAQLVVEEFKASLMSRSGAMLDFSTEPLLLVVPKDLTRGNGPVEVLPADDAVARMDAACEGSQPFLTAHLTEQVTSVVAIPYKTTTKESSDYVKGYSKVLTKGINGKKQIVTNVVRINGQVVGTQVVSETVLVKPVNQVVLKGTATRVYSYSSRSVATSGQAIPGTTGADIVAYARQFLGNPYVYGGTSLTNGTDCSGFTKSVYAHFGVYLPHSSSAQRYYGVHVSYSEARPGDLIFYSGHVAIYIGGGKIIHASTPSTDICIGSATYDRILEVRRIL